mgnify:CR=1 FL=1
MSYSPECVKEFEAKFKPGGLIRYCPEQSRYTPVPEHEEKLATPIQILALGYTAQLVGFAANWERVRELEEALKDLADEADYIMSTDGQGNKRDLYSFVVDARKLLEAE